MVRRNFGIPIVGRLELLNELNVRVSLLGLQLVRVVRGHRVDTGGGRRTEVKRQT